MITGQTEMISSSPTNTNPHNIVETQPKYKNKPNQSEDIESQQGLPPPEMR